MTVSKNSVGGVLVDQAAKQAHLLLDLIEVLFVHGTRLLQLVWYGCCRGNLLDWLTYLDTELAGLTSIYLIDEPSDLVVKLDTAG